MLTMLDYGAVDPVLLLLNPPSARPTTPPTDATTPAHTVDLATLTPGVHNLQQVDDLVMLECAEQLGHTDSCVLH
jgi:hypothetical protein